MIKIRKLTHKYLEEASVLADKVFGYQESPPRIGFEASFSPQVLKDLNARNGNKFSWFNYWVAIDTETDRIVGTTGIYEEKSDASEACWLGWYCVDPKYQGRGIGKQLLEFSINQSMKLNKQYLRLFTSTNPRSDSAQIVYEKMGFRVMEDKRREKDGEYEIFYRELLLE